MESSTRLAFERTFLAHERTQMAWLRTSLALISFGFAIAKFYQYLQDQADRTTPVFSAFTVGVVMISVGLLSLGLAVVQHRRAMSHLRAECPELPHSVAGFTAFLIMLMGLLALANALWRAW